MSELTILQVNRDDLAALIERATKKAVETALLAMTAAQEMTVADMARHYGISTTTVRAREKAGRLPPRMGATWRRGDVLRWDRDRS